MVKELIWKYTTFDIQDDNGLQLDFVLENIPPGWSELYKVYDKSIHVFGAKSIRLYYGKGVLRSKCVIYDDSKSQGFNKVLHWLTNGLSISSAHQCLINPNEPGWQRKGYTGWPPLSTAVYIEYANELTEEEEKTWLHRW